MRLVGSSNRIVQLYVHPFAVDTRTRSQEAQAYLRSYYEDFAVLQEQGLDALIITGANPAQADIARVSSGMPISISRSNC